MESHVEAPGYWSSKNKPRKACTQQLFANCIANNSLLSDQGKSVDSGLNLVVMAGPNLKKVIESYFWLLGRNGKLFSAEIAPNVFSNQEKQWSKLPSCKQKVTRIHFGDWYNLAEEVVQKNRICYLEMDFCSTIDREWAGSLHKIQPIIEKIHQAVDKIYVSVNHCTSRYPKATRPKEFLVNRFPKLWENFGWSCQQCEYAPYKSGGFSMYPAFYRFERRKT